MMESTSVAFFLGLSLASWGILFIGFVFVAFFTAGDRIGSSLLTFALGSLLLLWLTEINVFRWVSQHPLQTILYLSGYLFAGIFWSLFKWRHFVSEASQQLERIISSFIERTKMLLVAMMNSPESPAARQSDRRLTDLYLSANKDQVASWVTELEQGRIPDALLDYWKSERPFCDERELPKVSTHQEKIISWIVHWPWSVLGYLLTDILRDLASWFVELTKGVYNSITRGAYRGIDERLTRK